MNHLYFYILLVLNFQTISGQKCDKSSNTTQCSDGRICGNDGCEDALYCGRDTDRCAVIIGLVCVSDYCQPDPCTSTGQCAHGRICSQDTNRRCVYPVVANVEEGSEHTFIFKEPAIPGNYEEIWWYKGSKNSLNRIAIIHPVIGGNKIEYYNDFCSDNSPCGTSDIAQLNTDTGELTIHKVQLSDEGFYYYEFYITDGMPDTGVNYEYKLNVYVTGDLTIEGVPNEYVEVGTNLTLTCTIDRIRPEPLGMYWVIDGRNITGNITTKYDDSDGVFSQTSTYIHNVTKEDGKIECVVVLVYGDPMSVVKTINPGYEPSGLPILEALPQEQHMGEGVKLTCHKPEEDGNPSCDNFLWKKGGDKVTNGTENSYEFTVDKAFTKNDSSYANYTCACGNKFGNSKDSKPVEIFILPGTLPESHSTGGGGGGGNVALIGGAIGGILFIVLIIIIVVFITRRKNKPKAAPDDEPKQLVQNGVQPEPVYAQPDKSKRKLRPQRGLDEGPQYANTEQLQGENPYENTGVDNNNPPTKQNGIMPPELIYIEVDVGKKDAKANGNKPVPKERSSMRKPKINRSDDPTMYAEIQPKA